MKKILSLAVALVLMALCFTTTAFAENAEPEDYTRLIAMGMDPYGIITLDETIDPDTVKWAVVYYRLNSPLDSKGIGYVGQFFVVPAQEPHIVVEYDTTTAGEWKKTVVDMTNVGVEGMTSQWTSSTTMADFGLIRFDPMEINRFDPIYGGEVLEGAHVQDGDNIDIAYIAFFDSEEKANEFDGTQDTYVTMITPDMLYDMTNESGTLLTLSKAEVEGTVEPDESEDESTDESTEESEADASVEESEAEASAEGSKAEASKDESKADASEATSAENSSAANEGEDGSNLGLIIGIIAAVVVIAVVAVVIIKKKK